MTSLVEMAAYEGKQVAAISITAPAEALGCDDFLSLAAAEKHYFRRRAADLMKNGVRFRDPDSVSISADSEIGSGTVIERNVSIEGRTGIGSNCRIGQDSVIRDSQLANGCQVTSSRIIGSECGPTASIGPNALIRDGASIGEGAQAGNCVEVKNSRIGAGTLIGHLCYVGDADVGGKLHNRRRGNHLQFRRSRQTPHRNWFRGVHRFERFVDRAGRDWRWRGRRGRVSRNPGCSGRENCLRQPRANSIGAYPIGFGDVVPNLAPELPGTPG